LLQLICTILASDENICREAVKLAPAADVVMAGAGARCPQVQHGTAEETSRGLLLLYVGIC